MHLTATPDQLLLVDDDAELAEFLADNLAADGFEVVIAGTAADGLRRLEYDAPDLALIDLTLPDASGFDLLRAVREADALHSRLNPATPLMVLSGRAGEMDRLRGFDRGADDFVAKPFSYPELLARIRAVLRRARGRRTGAGLLKVGALIVDPVSHQVTLRGKPITLPGKEFALLQRLATEPTRVFSKEELLRDVWGFRSMGRTRTLDSHACRLRHRLGVDGDQFVVNVWGVGYRLVDGAAA